MSPGKIRLWPLRMSIPHRHSDPEAVIAGARTFFVTTSTHDKRHTLQSDRSARLFLHVLYDYRSQDRFRLHEFVVMPDHIHLLLTVDVTMTIEKAVQFIKGGFAFRAGKELGARAPFWQKGFSEIRIRDANAFQQAARYIRNNPVEAGFVGDAKEYPYSSANLGFDVDPAPVSLGRVLDATQNAVPEGGSRFSSKIRNR
ncbi:MAG: transposase [Acidobacteriia bacterium]|nr:transposase [Terriglobia bacterium]